MVADSFYTKSSDNTSNVVPGKAQPNWDIDLTVRSPLTDRNLTAHANQKHSADSGNSENSDNKCQKPTTQNVETGDKQLRPSDKPSPIVTTGGAIDPTRLPDGSQKIATDGPTVGKVFVSPRAAERMKTAEGGATSEGTWLNRKPDGTLDGTYNSKTKTVLEGDSVLDNQKHHIYRNKDGSITFTGNTIPSTAIGKFPLDPAKYGSLDNNPNKVEAHDFSFTFPLNPKPADKPSPVGSGAIAVLYNGSVMFNALDEKGNDANARELQDKNLGHPAPGDLYHVHQVPPVLYQGQDKTAPSPVLGRALDGYPIVAAYKPDGQLYSTNELDKFHGKEVEIRQEDGTVKKQWAYCVSLDYPYTIGAFKGTPGKVQGLPEMGQPPAGGKPGERKDDSPLPSIQITDNKNTQGSPKTAKLETTLYDLAEKSLIEKQKSAADKSNSPVHGDDVYRELNRIMTLNGYQSANLDGRHHITDKNLPNSWNNVHQNQEFKMTDKSVTPKNKNSENKSDKTKKDAYGLPALDIDNVA